MSEDELKGISLKEFNRIITPVNEYGNNDYIRLYAVKDNSKYFNRLFALTHHEYKTQIKEITGNKSELTHRVSYWVELPLNKFYMHEKSDSLLNQKEVIVFNIHGGNAYNVQTLLKMFELTKSDDLNVEYYSQNNSNNNTKLGLWNDTISLSLRKYPKNGNKDAVVTHRVYCDNEYIPGTMCSLTGSYHSISTKELFEQFGINSIYGVHTVSVCNPISTE